MIHIPSIISVKGADIMKRTAVDIIMAAGLALSLLLGGMRSFATECESIQDEVLRLHIPANSDSAEDQQMKLRLRDHILNEYGSQLAGETDITAAKAHIEALLPEIERDCCEFLKTHGADYSASAELTEMYFTTRTYENVTLPAGEYAALRITLGSGEGRNWWCVMFPPLCLPAASEITEDIPDSLIGDGAELEVKFAVYEFFKKLLSR